MKRSSGLRRRSPIQRGGRIKTRKRSAKDFARVYHSVERVQFVASLPCAGCGRGPCEGHHIANAGMSRKADYTRIVPLCTGCHRQLHDMGRTTYERLHEVSLSAAAVMTEARWISHSVTLGISRNINEY